MLIFKGKKLKETKVENLSLLFYTKSHQARKHEELLRKSVDKVAKKLSNLDTYGLRGRVFIVFIDRESENRHGYLGPFSDKSGAAGFIRSEEAAKGKLRIYVNFHLLYDLVYDLIDSRYRPKRTILDIVHNQKSDLPDQELLRLFQKTLEATLRHEFIHILRCVLQDSFRLLEKRRRKLRRIREKSDKGFNLIKTKHDLKDLRELYFAMRFSMNNLPVLIIEEGFSGIYADLKAKRINEKKYESLRSKAQGTAHSTSEHFANLFSDINEILTILNEDLNNSEEDRIQKLLDRVNFSLQMLSAGVFSGDGKEEIGKHIIQTLYFHARMTFRDLIRMNWRQVYREYEHTCRRTGIRPAVSLYSHSGVLCLKEVNSKIRELRRLFKRKFF